MGVVGLGQGVVGHVRVEVRAALGAAVLRVDKLEVAGPTGDQVANVVEYARERVVATAPLRTSWAASMLEVATAPNKLCWR